MRGIDYYVASRWAAGPGLCQGVVDHLNAAGHSCLHRWWLVPERPERPDRDGDRYTAEEWASIGDTDLDAVADADVVVVLAAAGREGLGMWVELGYARALEKPILLCVPAEHADMLALTDPSPFFFGRWMRRLIYADEQDLVAQITAAFVGYAHLKGRGGP